MTESSPTGNAFAKSKSKLFPLSQRAERESKKRERVSFRKTSRKIVKRVRFLHTRDVAADRSPNIALEHRLDHTSEENWSYRPGACGSLVSCRLYVARALACVSAFVSRYTKGAGNWVRCARGITRDRRVTGIAFLRGRLRISGLIVVENSINETATALLYDLARLINYTVSLSLEQAICQLTI